MRIKNWNSCVPEEVRQNTEFMPIYAFEKIVYPVRMPSPFLGKGRGQVKGTGGIIGHSDVPEGPFESDVKKRAAMTASTSALTPRVAVNAAPGGSAHAFPSVPSQILQRAPGVGSDKSILSAAGASNSTHIEKIPPETGTRILFLEFNFPFRYADSFVYVAKLFDRDPETNQVLWFAAPPLNQPRPRGARHSLAYLQFVATKRKRTTKEGDDVVTRSSQRTRTTETETMREILENATPL